VAQTALQKPTIEHWLKN